MRSTSFAFATAALGLGALASCMTMDEPLPPAPPSQDATPICAVVESREWSAWVNAMPGPGASATLHVVGEIVLPTPGYTATLSAGPADRSARPVQQMILALTPPSGPVAQVLTPATVRYQGPAVSMQYGGVRIMCGGTMLTEIADVIVAR